MNKQQRKAWDVLVNYAYGKALACLTEESQQVICAADVHIRKLERQLGEKKVAALLNAKFNKVLPKGN